MVLQTRAVHLNLESDSDSIVQPLPMRVMGEGERELEVGGGGVGHLGEAQNEEEIIQRFDYLLIECAHFSGEPSASGLVWLLAFTWVGLCFDLLLQCHPSTYSTTKKENCFTFSSFPMVKVSDYMSI